ncbi:hydroxymethylglutaryl-CoA synthase [Pyxidicoccus fallax]|uniref:Hydroxymethylglutaryl-CoA synthase n=1 Tax=Pyxidicoccus fallax TaxID=394095 RepID=A0A848LVC5_9BACT|nr:hydroxymethylglutaryl-CoA synthase [Pyxidicoccus fallax]NMO21274.1 hydroxymethylglutaryl-CoA synthase [Pyxidicoccus fallax]NPC83896.1 hydroxymethylglutaryl-CoA synthase [Pyxidicoccus fallax]
MQAGLEGIGIAVPTTYVELSELAVARGVAPGKYVEGLGVTRMCVPLEDEDTVTLAARAARMALQSAGCPPEQVGMLVVGTETAVDHSKPVASYVQGLLGLPTNCRVFETKHACYGGTAALQMALDWVHAGSAKGRKALIVCSDIARYGIGTPGEPTQGAGAVAMLVSDQPRLVVFEKGKTGVYSKDVMDFWRPLYSKDALVDGHYSVQCYLDALAGAYRAYQEAAGEEPAGEGLYSDRFAALVYHVPYGKMSRKAHRHLRTLDGDTDPDASFDRLVGSSLVLPSQVGNIYTGSMYMALASLLSTSREDLTGRRVGLFSYGSGSCAEFFSGVVRPEAQARVRSLGLEGLLERRRKLSIPEYEEVMRARERIDEKPVRDAPGTDFRYQGTRDHKRVYAS